MRRWLAGLLGTVLGVSVLVSAAQAEPVVRRAATVVGPVFTGAAMQYPGSADRGTVALDNDQGWISGGFRFSPDGAWLADLRGAPGWNSTIGVRRAAAPARRTTLLTTAGQVWSLAWAPDGRSIAFVGKPTTASALGVWAVPVTGGAADLVAALPPELASSGDLAWSPDGTRIAFVANARDPDTGRWVTEYANQIHVTTPEGGVERFNQPWEPAPPGSGGAYVRSTFSGLRWLQDGRIAATWSRLVMDGVGAETHDDAIVTIGEGERDPVAIRWFQQGGSGNLAFGLDRAVWSADERRFLVRQPVAPPGDKIMEVNALSGAVSSTALSEIVDWQPCPTGTCAHWVAVPKLVVVLNGTGVVGRNLGFEDRSPGAGGLTDFELEWLRDDRRIPGQVGQARVLTRSDAGHVISVRATVAVPGAPVASASTNRRKVAGWNVALPRVVGKARVGTRLAGPAGTWAAPGYRMKRQWLRQGRPIARATGSTYRVTKMDRGRPLSLRVTATRSGWPTVTAVSRATRVR